MNYDLSSFMSTLWAELFSPVRVLVFALKSLVGRVFVLVLVLVLEEAGVEGVGLILVAIVVVERILPVSGSTTT
jgi:hypothetical protein